jgi:hypothetical protein
MGADMAYLLKGCRGQSIGFLEAIAHGDTLGSAAPASQPQEAIKKQ